jgi:ABC-type proline/glycine betaine transport system ATPase subunit
MKKNLIFLTLLLLGKILQAQDPQQILNTSEQKYSRVKKFTADVNIQSDIPAMKILPAQANISYVAPNNLEVTSKSIIVLPKQGFREIQNIVSQKNKYTPIYMGQEIINGRNSHLITLLPKSDAEDWIMAKIWIDVAESLIMQSQTTTKSSGTLKVNYVYNSQKQWALPDQMLIEVDVQKFKIPKGVATDLHRSRETKDQGSIGKINLTFLNYKVN